MTKMHKIIRDLADDDRAYDPCGSGMLALGAVCDVLAVKGGDIPADAGYSSGALGVGIDPEDNHATDLLAGLDPDAFPGHWVEGYTPNLTLADVEYAAVILSRYLDFVRLAGRDY